MKKKAFTLIELLVVIAVIAVLLSILLPSLKKAKLIAQTIVCSANTRTMSQAWTTYAQDNAQRIVSSKTGFGRFAEHLVDPIQNQPGISTPHAWVDWAGYPAANGSDKDRQILAVERGALYPYVRTTKAYICPASKKDQARCYVIPDILGYPTEFFSKHQTLGDAKVIVKTTDMNMTSERLVFLDEDEISYGGFTIWYNKAEWWDRPPKRHNSGVTMGFADGHTSYYKWRDKRTRQLATGEIGTLNQPGNQDLEYIQRSVYGSLGYVPTPKP